MDLSVPSRAGMGLLPGAVSCLALLLLMGTPGSARAQNASCEFLEGTENFNMITLAGGGSISYLSSPRIGCPDGVRIVADSAISYSAQDMTHLLGNVFFRDGSRELQAREARYFPSTGRLQATGDVRLENADDGTVIENGDLVLLRETDFRDRAELTVTTGPDRVRPRATLFIRPAADTAVVDTAGEPAPADSALPADPSVDTVVLALPTPDTVAPPAADTAPPTPYLVVADRLHFVGDEYFEAVGNAEIDRDSIHATAQRAEYDQEVGLLVLRGSAHLDGSTYDLEGDEIDLRLPAGEVREVTARRKAVLTGEEIRLDAPVIHLFLVEDLLDRLVAVPMDPGVVDTLDAPDSLLLARPVATAEEFVLTADSVDVRAPGQELDRIYAVGTARGESMARDSLNVEALPETARRDWLEGDTIIATFRRAGAAAPVAADTATADVADAPDVPPADTAAVRGAAGADGEDQEYVLDELVASGSARSLYRLLPSDSTARPGVDPPAVHYVTGSRITIALLEGDVDRMEVEGPSQGYHLEPLRQRAVSDTLGGDTLPPPPADTARAVPDTGGTGPVRPAAPEPAEERSRHGDPGSRPWSDGHPGVNEGRRGR